MKKLAITAAAVGALAATAVGLAGTAGAVQQGGSAADVIKMLQDQGYSVRLNGSTTAPLPDCTVTGIHGLTMTLTPDGLMVMMTQSSHFDTVYIDVSCPSTNN
jgi:hypothetical protein